MEENNSLSRRQWLGKITVPAVAAGATMIGLKANASPVNDEKENKLAGAAVYNVRDHGAKGDGKTLILPPYSQRSISALMKKGEPC